MKNIELGDRWYERRGEKASGSRARPEPIEQSIACFRKEIAEAPGDLEAHWRLIRALFFRGAYASGSTDEERNFFEAGKEAGEKALDVIREALSKKARRDLSGASPVELVRFAKGNSPVVGCFLWSGVCWGRWAVAYGKLAAVRQGAGARIKDFATAAVDLDPLREDAGGHRLLGRLHFETPFVPLVTGWASKQEALKHLSRAVELAPRSRISRQYLAEAIWTFEPKQRAEAIRLLEGIVAGSPAPDLLIEELRSQEESRALLATWRNG